jgi:prevent-host-death family protein
MKIIDIRKAKAQLFKLIDEAYNGEPFVIAKAGKPLVKVTALSTPARQKIKRLGFMIGQISVPDDFDRMGEKKIEHLFKSGK